MGHQAKAALMSTILVQIGEPSLRDEPTQEKLSVSVNGDLGFCRRTVKQVFSEN
jgi:hypothetical protein